VTPMGRWPIGIVVLALLAVLALPASAAAPQKSPSAKRAASAATALGIALERNAGRGNVAVSPVSAWMALTMPYAGAAGQTRAQMAHVLHVRTFAERTGAANRALARALRVDARKSHATFGLANALWGESQLPFRQAFLDTLRHDYRAPLRRLDFEHHPDGSRAAINRWVEERTHGRIKSLLKKADVTKDTQLALVNALYLRARWLNAFDPGLTQKRAFHAPGRDVRVPMMYRESTIPYARLRGLRAVALPYRGKRLSMLVVLPDHGRIKAVQRALSVRSLARIATRLRRQRVDLSLPRFHVATRLELTDVLVRLGMRRAFDDAAEFPGVSPDPLKLHSVVQKVWIRVGEKGTEAAAATGITGVPTSAVYPPPKRFDANRPFLFAVRDNRTGAVLFLGRVEDPSK
jgi:serpin B